MCLQSLLNHIIAFSSRRPCVLRQFFDSVGKKVQKITNNKLIVIVSYHSLFSALRVCRRLLLQTATDPRVYVAVDYNYPLTRPNFRSSLLPFMYYYMGSWVAEFGGVEHQKD